MKVEYLTSACVVVEHEGVRVLCDPWLTDGIYYGSWHHYPQPAVSPEEVAPDFVYISHVHPDHLDMATLKRLPTGTPVLILDFAEKFVHRIVTAAGFTDIREVAHGDTVELGPDFRLELLAADNCDPEACGKHFGCVVPGPYDQTLQIDSIGVFSGGGTTVVNVNDAPWSIARGACEAARERYGRPDLLLVGYSGAGPFPQCFDLPHEQMLDRAAAKRRQFLGQAMQFLKLFEPLAFMPFAGQYTLGGTLAPLNRYRGVPEVEELEDAFAPLLHEAGLGSQLVQLNSGESFDLETMTASAPFTPPDPEERRRYSETVLSKVIFPYQGERRVSAEEWADLTPRLREAQARMLRHQDAYGGYRSDWSIYLDTGQERLYRVPFDGSEVTTAEHGAEQSPFVRVGIDYSLLTMILDRKAHWNNASIGSHLRFSRDPDHYERGIHHFMAYFHC